MAITFTGTGGLFTRLGRILHVGYQLTPFESSIPALYKQVFDQYLASLEEIGGAVEVQSNTLARIPSGVMNFATQAGSDTVQGMVLADQASQSITLQGAIQEVIRQMIVGGYYVTPNAITITPAQLPSFVGNGVLVTSTKRGDGLVQENSIAEVLRLTCTSDSYTGGRTQGQEQFGLTGAPVLGGVWDYDYPTGSGASAALNAISAAEYANPTGNLLTNGNFEVWTDDAIPELNFWTLGTGTWGTNIKRDTTAPNQGTYALQFQASGVNTTLYQEFGDATDGTAVEPDGLRSYSVNLWVRKLSGTISAGVLRVALVDASGTVLNDQQGLANSFNITCSALTTSYVAYNAVFRLNATPPSEVRLQLRMTTALAGGDVLVDDACYAPMTSFYQGGPGLAIFSGATPFVAASAWNLTVTNNQGGASYCGTFQTGFERLFSMRNFGGAGLLLPSTGSTLINNSLISA